MLDAGYWMLGAGCWVIGYWMLDALRFLLPFLPKPRDLRAGMLDAGLPAEMRLRARLRLRLRLSLQIADKGFSPPVGQAE